jgi:hypothetical protein
MTLFSLKDLKGESQPQSKAKISAGASSASSLRRRDEVAKAVQAIRQGESMHFVSEGQWSMHELLEEMLEKIGPADVFVTTWTITKDPVRRIVMLKQEGRIRSLNCLLDYRIRDRKPAPFQLLQANADRISLAKCHAKVTVAINDDWALSCLSSANYSRNPRFEAGIISASRGDAQFHIDWITEAIQKHAK